MNDDDDEHDDNSILYSTILFYTNIPIQSFSLLVKEHAIDMCMKNILFVKYLEQHE